MSDTPRTNARVKQMIDNGQSAEGLEYFARQLERELNAANERIKRLEEAGDEMARWLSSPRNIGGDRLMAAEWDKAKEAKP